LNAFGSGQPFDPYNATTATAPAQGKLATNAINAITVGRVGGEILFRVEAAKPYVIRITDARGTMVAELKGEASGMRSLPVKGLAHGSYAATLLSEGKSLSKAFANF
jgi:hypothetical protein